MDLTDNPITIPCGICRVRLTRLSIGIESAYEVEGAFWMPNSVYWGEPCGHSWHGSVTFVGLGAIAWGDVVEVARWAST
jgi:hypothetical protein